MLRLAKDDIPDPLSQWIVSTPEFGDPGVDSGRHVQILDRLGAADTWINTFYADWKYASPNQWSTFHRFKWETWRQRNTGNRLLVDDEGRQAGHRRRTRRYLRPPRSTRPQRSPVLGIFGLNRQGGIPVFVAGFDHLSKAKSEFLSQTPFDRTWTNAAPMTRFSFCRSHFRASCARPGSKAVWNSGSSTMSKLGRNLQVGQLSGDFRGTVLALQLTNPSTYLGYNDHGGGHALRSEIPRKGRRQTPAEGLGSVLRLHPGGSELSRQYFVYYDMV